MSAIFSDEIKFYTEREKRDPSTRFWGSVAGQQARFAAIVRQTGLAQASLVDAGCGSGDFLAYLIERGQAPSAYYGIDITPKFVEEARARGLPGEFHVGDLAEPTCTIAPADWVTANGIFCLHQADGLWWQRYRTISQKLWEACRVGVAFTFVSIGSPMRRPETHYANPVEIFTDAQERFGNHLIIDHAYLSNDFLLVARRSTAVV